MARLSCSVLLLAFAAANAANATAKPNIIWVMADDMVRFL